MEDFSLRKVNDHWEALNNKKIYLFNTKKQTLKIFAWEKKTCIFFKNNF